MSTADGPFANVDTPSCFHCGTTEGVRLRRAMPYGPAYTPVELCDDCWRDVLGIFPERPKP